MGIHPRIEIIKALKTSRKNQRWLARQAGLQESAVSLIVNGRLNPTDDQMSAIAGVLGIDQGILFS